MRSEEEGSESGDVLDLADAFERRVGQVVVQDGATVVMSATRSVRVSPGRIALTRMLLAPSSSAANCTRWSTPDFETPYAPNQRCVLLLAIDEIATMDPPPPATSARAPCLIVSMVPVTLRSTVRRQASTSSCVTGAMVSFPPAQATTPSSFPVTDTAAATAATTSVSIVTSAGETLTDPSGLDCRIDSAAASSFSLLRPQIVT